MEVDGGSVGGGGGGGEGSSRVPTTSFSSSGARQRFYIELRPGETTIVSWKRLVKDVNPSPPAAEPPVPGAQQSREAQFPLVRLLRLFWENFCLVLVLNCLFFHRIRSFSQFY